MLAGHQRPALESRGETPLDDEAQATLYRHTDGPVAGSSAGKYGHGDAGHRQDAI